MSNPSTEQIRKTYAQHVSDYTSLDEATHAAEFDRWLAQEKAKLLRQAARDLNWFGAQGNLVHPDTAWAGVKACITALENQADTIESEHQ